MTEKTQESARELLKRLGLDFRTLSVRYSEKCWVGWKRGKTNDLYDRKNPFVGGPNRLIKAFAEGEADRECFTDPSGEPIWINPLSRIKLSELSDTAIEIIEQVYGKKISHLKGTCNKDVLHPEYVKTFQENIGNSREHLTNNQVTVSAILDTVFSTIANDKTTPSELVTILNEIIDGEPSLNLLMFHLASRRAWLGRACADGSWEKSDDFTFNHQLPDNTVAIDSYVMLPILQAIIKDLKTEFGTKEQQS